MKQSWSWFLSGDSRRAGHGRVNQKEGVGEAVLAICSLGAATTLADAEQRQRGGVQGPCGPEE